MKYRVYTDPLMSKHEMGPQHLESPTRLELITRALAQSNLDYTTIVSKNTLQHQQSRLKNFIQKLNGSKYFTPVSPRLLARVHDDSLIQFILESSVPDGVWITPDTRTNEYTFSAAILAAGAGVAVAQDANHGRPAVALVRPPGHHATRLASMGFCFFNNIAIGAQFLLDAGVDRIMIIDIDNHYGNGTANVFYDDNRVLFWSIHADPRVAYPGIGFVNELGKSKGLGYNINIPVPAFTSDAGWLDGLRTFLLPLIDEYNPRVLLVSLGLDALNGDPYGSLSISQRAYAEAGRLLREAIGKTKKIGVYLEGGYKYDELGDAFVAFFEGLNNDVPEYAPNLPSTSELPKLFSQYSGVFRKYWNV